MKQIEQKAMLKLKISCTSLSLLFLTKFAYPSIPPTQPETIGFFYSIDGAYLNLATYGLIDRNGPKQLNPTLRPRQNFYVLSGSHKICFNIQELKAFLPKSSSIQEAVNYLPTTENTSVVPDSIFQPSEDTLCYLLRKSTRSISEDDFKKALSESEALFSTFKGLETIPEESRDELNSLWGGNRTIDKKIKLLTKYWRKKIKYTPGALQTLKNFLKENPSQNILQALLKLRISDCGPKNFALGVSIWELSKKTIPVRLSYAIWLLKSSNKEEPLTTDRLHIHVEYLIKNKKGRYIWETAESALDSAVYRQLYQK